MTDSTSSKAAWLPLHGSRIIKFTHLIVKPTYDMNTFDQPTKPHARVFLSALSTRRAAFFVSGAALASSLLAGCASIATPSAATASRATASCGESARAFSHPALSIQSAELVAANTLRIPGIDAPMPEHCVVKGRLNERKSPVDDKDYAIGFEMRLPTAWNGRFF